MAFPVQTSLLNSSNLIHFTNLYVRALLGGCQSLLDVGTLSRRFSYLSTGHMVSVYRQPKLDLTFKSCELLLSHLCLCDVSEPGKFLAKGPSSVDVVCFVCWWHIAYTHERGELVALHPELAFFGCLVSVAVHEFSNYTHVRGVSIRTHS